jgi:hydroxymethylpyrimidine pyrophosphatase-like HAD family hydrolase
MYVKMEDENNRFVKDMKGKKVYIELFSGRKYFGTLDGVNDFHARLIQTQNGLLVVFPISEIKFIQEEK